MASSFLFHLSSFFVDRLLDKSQTLYNKELSVILRNGTCMLDSGKANYSFGNLHKAFQQTFSRTKLQDKRINNVLILGFGAGSIAHILRNELKIPGSIIGVEIDAKIIEYAANYFQLKDIPNCTIVNQDAYLFLESDERVYDLITVDLFQEMDVPEVFQTETFLRMLKDHMHKDASLYFNFVVDNALQKNNFNKFEKIFYVIFPNAVTLAIMESNRVLYSSENASVTT